MLKLLSDYLKNTGELSKRIKRRHTILWQDPDSETIRNTQMSRHQPLSEWQNVPLWQRKLSNKSNAREFAILHNCKVADLYWRGSAIDQLNFDKLPAQYVIRPTVGHSCNDVFLMKNGVNLFDNKRYGTEEICSHLKRILKSNPQTQFLVEEFLQNEKNEYSILDDYKFYCFNGHIASCHIINRFSPKTGYCAFYDEKWTKMTQVHQAYPLKPDQVKPLCYDEMVECAKALSQAYQIFVRIDFYATSKGAVFGEFTPTPGMGGNFTQYGRRLLLGYWEKYCKDMI